MIRIEFTDGAYITNHNTFEKIELGTVQNMYISPKASASERESVLLCAATIMANSTDVEKKIFFAEMFGVHSKNSCYMTEAFVNDTFNAVRDLIQQRYNTADSFINAVAEQGEL